MCPNQRLELERRLWGWWSLRGCPVPLHRLPDQLHRARLQISYAQGVTQNNSDNVDLGMFTPTGCLGAHNNDVIPEAADQISLQQSISKNLVPLGHRGSKLWRWIHCVHLINIWARKTWGWFREETTNLPTLYMVLKWGALTEGTRCNSRSRKSNEPHPHVFFPFLSVRSHWKQHTRTQDQSQELHRPKTQASSHPTLWLRTSFLNIKTKTWDGYGKSNGEDTETAAQAYKLQEKWLYLQDTPNGSHESWVTADQWLPEDKFQRDLSSFTVRWLEHSVLKAVGKNSLRDIVKICVFYYM